VGVSVSPRFLHVANGGSTTGTIREAGISGATSIWADVLYEGPVPGGLPDDALVRVRAEQLAPDSNAVDDVVAELTGWRQAVDNDQAYDELVLWFEHDLFDQLNLIQILSRIGPRLERTKPVSLICIGSFPGRPQFKGLGELTPVELASLFGTRQRVTAGQCALANRAWQAFRATDPSEVQQLLKDDVSALPFLSAALARYLEEFPWTTDGLSRTERRLMELAAPAPLDIHAAFPRMHDREVAYYVTDGSYWSVIEGLASASPALITTDARWSGRGLPEGTVAITPFGHAVLAGEEDRVRRAGLDRWLGGVHLSGFGPTWRWDPVRGGGVFT